MPGLSEPGQLPDKPLMAFEPFLWRQGQQPLRLGYVATVVRHDRHFQVEATQADEASHIVQTRRRPARFPSRDS